MATAVRPRCHAHRLERRSWLQLALLIFLSRHGVRAAAMLDVAILPAEIEYEPTP